jgi:hypothetical protein
MQQSKLNPNAAEWSPQPRTNVRTEQGESSQTDSRRPTADQATGMFGQFMSPILYICCSRSRFRLVDLVFSDRNSVVADIVVCGQWPYLRQAT